MKGQVVGKVQAEATGTNGKALQRCRFELTGFSAAFVDANCRQQGDATYMTHIKQSVQMPTSAVHFVARLAPFNIACLC